MFLANLSGKVSGMKVYKISNFLPSIWFVINLFHHNRKNDLSFKNMFCIIVGLLHPESLRQQHSHSNPL